MFRGSVGPQFEALSFRGKGLQAGEVAQARNMIVRSLLRHVPENCQAAASGLACFWKMSSRWSGLRIENMNLRSLWIHVPEKYRAFCLGLDMSPEHVFAMGRHINEKYDVEDSLETCSG